MTHCVAVHGRPQSECAPLKQTLSACCRPPEKIQAGPGGKHRFGFAADMWALGITLVQLLNSNLDAPYGSGTGPLTIVMQVRP